MKVAIMQPYFFPYIGYFQLIQAVDQFILFDDVQYIRHGWINRNRILKSSGGHQYIIAPLSKHHQQTKIKEINVVDGSQWKEKVLRQIEHYKKKAPFYLNVKNLLEDCFALEETSITLLNAYYLKKACQFIGIQTPIHISSSIGFDYASVNDKDEWALNISEQLRASIYINPAGGKYLFDKEKFKHKNIDLNFLQTGDVTYMQGRAFEPSLSILDVMMFNSTNDIKLMLNNYDIV